MKRTRATAATFALLVLACGGPESLSPGPDPAMADPVSPKHVLANVEMAFEERHKKTLKASVADDFVFHFGEGDVGARVNGYVIPTSWTEAELRLAAEHIFARAWGVGMSISHNGLPEPGPGEETFRTEEVHLWFAVDSKRSHGFRTYGGYCNFEFESYSSAEGKKFWRLTSWEDRTSAGPAEGDDVEYSTFGRILARYYN